MDNLIDHESFEIELPLWTIVNQADLSAKGLARSIPRVCSSDGEIFVPLFTDDDLAGRFITDVAAAGLETVKITEAETLLVVLNTLKKLGATHVGFDATEKPRRQGRFYEIGRFIRVIAGGD